MQMPLAYLIIRGHLIAKYCSTFSMEEQFTFFLFFFNFFSNLFGLNIVYKLMLQTSLFNYDILNQLKD